MRMKGIWKLLRELFFSLYSIFCIAYVGYEIRSLELAPVILWNFLTLISIIVNWHNNWSAESAHITMTTGTRTRSPGRVCVTGHTSNIEMMWTQRVHVAGYSLKCTYSYKNRIVCSFRLDSNWIHWRVHCSNVKCTTIRLRNHWTLKS